MVDPSPPPPYGPRTPQVRTFLKRLAQLPSLAWLAAARRYEPTLRTPPGRRADAALARAFERSGRDQARTALIGPVVQLARRAVMLPDAGDATGEDSEFLEQVAEPALAAAFAVLLADVLPPAERDTLYAPFADAIPLHELEPRD